MRLLLLDHTPEAREVVRETATRAGHELWVADSVDQASALLDQQSIECVIISPGFCRDEDERARLVEAKRGSKAAVLVVAGCADEMRSAYAGDVGLLRDFTVKPLAVETMTARLELIAHRLQAQSRENAMLKALPDLVFRIDRNDTYLDVHAPNEDDLYVPKSEIIGKRTADVLPPDLVVRIHDATEIAVETGKPQCVEYALDVPSGKTHFEARIVRAGENEVLSIVRDISEQKRLVAEIEHHRAKAQAFASRTLQVLESERQHLAQELHDVIGQMLLVHRMDVEWIAKRAQGPANIAAVALARSLDETLQAVRNLALGLRPPVLDDLGIGSALEALSGDLTRRSGVAIECIIDPAAEALDRDTAVTLYRIAQEALSNAIRHASPDNIELSLSRPDDYVELRVEDDGRGIEPETLSRAEEGTTGSLGLQGMRERARLLGGNVEVTPRAPTGTVVSAIIPQTETSEPLRT
jgi:signal transduction histidine kinase